MIGISGVIKTTFEDDWEIQPVIGLYLPERVA